MDQQKKTIKKELEITLTEEQRAKRSTIAEEAQAVIDEHNTELAKAESEYKTIKKRLEPLIEEQDQRRARALRENKKGTALVLTECEMLKNFEANEIEYWVDGKRHSARAMEPDERQATLWEDEAEGIPETGMGIAEANVVDINAQVGSPDILDDEFEPTEAVAHEEI